MKLPFNFQQWIDENRPNLKPPVSNKVMFQDDNFIIQVVGGPNSRTDFHVNQSAEFFYQLEGTAFLRTINQQGEFENIQLNGGDVFLLPALVPHSPQRSAGSVGLVIEKTRAKDDIDGLQWYCKSCTHKLYEEFFHLTNIETDFGAVFARYYNSTHVNCPKCGTVNGKTW